MLNPEGMRELTEAERGIMDALLKASFPGRDKLRRLLYDAIVSNIDEMGSLKIQSIVDLSADTAKRVPVEAEVSDLDGVAIHVLLHVMNGKPVELEIYKEDGSALLSAIDTSRLETLVLPPNPQA
ncbi:MAG: DUF6984 family protein [Caulobacteraceae bacterium]